jgi:hypothetical protein
VFRCEICQRSFREMTTLRKHEQLHRADRPYVCQTCGKSFLWSSNLKVSGRSRAGQGHRRENILDIYVIVISYITYKMLEKNNEWFSLILQPQGQWQVNSGSRSNQKYRSSDVCLFSSQISEIVEWKNVLACVVLNSAILGNREQLYFSGPPTSRSKAG